LWVFKAAKENIMFLTLLVASLFQFFVCVNSDYTISDDWLNLNTKCSIALPPLQVTSERVKRHGKLHT